MAKDAKQDAGAKEAPAPKKSKKLLIIVVITLLLLLVIGGAAAFLLMSGGAPADGEEGEVATEKAKPEKKKEAKEAIPVFVAMDAFTVNLDQDTGGQYLQVVISVEVEDMHMGDKIKTYTPKLRNNVIRLLSGKKASELISKEGKETLAGEIRTLMNEVLEPGAKEGPVKEVLFTSFIIQ
ncbi:MAG: flagellar basal body-associated protein FliL [Propionivibrio sp.]